MYLLLLVMPFWLALPLVLGASLGVIYWRWRDEIPLMVGAMLTALAVFILVFLVPISVPDLEPLPIDPIDATLSEGEEMVYFHISPTERTSKAPILFVHGGPGGATTPPAVKFLQDLANQTGRDVYTYDHYAGGRSSFEDPNRSLLTIEDEVRRLDEIVDLVSGEAIGADRPTVIGHSYAGALIGRHIAAHPGTFDKYVSLDTSPLYSLSGGNLKDTDLLNPDLEPLLDAGTSSSPNGGGVLTTTNGVFANLSLREIARGTYLIGPTILGGDGYKPPKFGNSTEAGYFLETFFAAISQAARFGDTDKLSYGAVGIIAQDVNASLTDSPDYAQDLLSVETPSVLSVHPQYGDIKWAFHKDYESFFPRIQYLPIPEGTHTNIYGDDEPPARQTLEAVVSFLRNEPINGTHTGTEDPFS